MNKVELLAPAGNFICGKTALDFGADAIYFGGKQYSLRARASNFDNKQLKEMIDYAHSLNKKAYLVVNIICHNHLLDGFSLFFNEIKDADAFIVSDPYILKEILKIKPNAIIHISTQQSTTNSKAALF
jgi:putative protease